MFSWNMTTTCVIGVVVEDDDSNAKLELLSKRDVIISAAIVVRIFVIDTLTRIHTFHYSANRSCYTIYQILSSHKNLFFM